MRATIGKARWFLLRLSPESEELMQAGREALRMSDADRERVLQALLARVGGGPGTEGADGPSGGLAAAKSTVAKATLVKALAVVVGLGVSGGGLYLALRSEPPSPSSAVVPSAIPLKEAPPQVAPLAIGESPKAAASPVPQAQIVETKTTKVNRQAARDEDSLVQEVAILSRASGELHAGRPAAALAALADHQRKFPAGMLTQERAAARIQALCALGRTQEAKAELAQLERTAPSSPHVGRARKACGFDRTDKE